MEAAIRGALDKAGIPGAQARRRIYDSARGALDRSLERQGITDPERIDEHRNKLEALIAGIEAEWAPPNDDGSVASPVSAAHETKPLQPAAVAAPPVGQAPPVEPAPVAAAPVRTPPVQPAASPAPPIRPDDRSRQAPGPAIDSPRSPVATQDNPRPSSSRPQDAAPAVAPASEPPRNKAESQAPSSGDAALDFAPDAGGHTAAASVAAPDLNAERPPHIEAPAGARPNKPGKKAKAAKAPKAARAPREKPKRAVFASFFSAAVMLSFLGIGVWWLIESGALMSAEERDTGVPNPPPSLSRDDFAGGPQQLNPGSGFSGEWANVYTPGRDGTAEASGNASVEVVEEADGNVLRIVSGTADANGEVRVPLGADVMQALAGRQSVLALTVRSATPEATQIYVRCEFSVLGDCGRRRFDVTYDTNDILFSLDYDRALAPNQDGYLVINSDVTGGAKGIDLIGVRIRPLT